MGTSVTNSQFKVSREPPHSILNKVKKTLKARGTHGIRGLGRVFRRMDNSGDRKLDVYEFRMGLRENGHKLDENEYKALFKYFDVNGDGVIN